jgi:hypothetical protein
MMFVNRLKRIVVNEKFLLLSTAAVLIASSLITFEFFSDDKILFRSAKYFGLAVLSFFICARYLIFKFKTRTYELLFFGYFFFSFVSAVINSESASQMILYLDIPLVVLIVFFGFSSLLQINVEMTGFVSRIFVIILIIASVNIIHNLARFIYLVVVFKDRNEMLTYLYLPYNWKGLVLNPNYNSYLMLLGLVVLTFLFWIVIRKNKKLINAVVPLYLAAFLATFGMIGITQCRAVVLSVIVGIICIVAMNLASQPVLKLRSKFLIISVAAVSASVLVFYRTLFSILLHKTYESGTSSRIEMWRSFFSSLMSDFSLFHFLFGYGGSISNHPYNHVNTHLGLANFVFDTLARNGFLAVAMLVVFVLLVLLSNIRKGNHMHNIALTVILIPNLFEDYLLYLGFSLGTILFFVLVAYSMNLSSARNDDQLAKE